MLFSSAAKINVVNAVQAIQTTTERKAKQKERAIIIGYIRSLDDSQFEIVVYIIELMKSQRRLRLLVGPAVRLSLSVACCFNKASTERKDE